MRKYITFAIWTVALYPVINIVWGWVLTIFYTPDISDAYSSVENLPQQVEFGGVGSPWMPVLTILLAAIGAYFITRNMFKNAKPGKS